MLLIPKVTGSAVVLPVNGRLSPAAAGLVVLVAAVPPPALRAWAFAAVVLVTSVVVPCAWMLVVVSGCMVVVVAAWVVVVVGASIVVVGGTVLVVVGGTEVVVVVVVGSQSLASGSEADAVESSVRFGLRMVRVTVPLDGAGPLASQICVVPELPVVL
jgi:hypothetical protein